MNPNRRQTLTLFIVVALMSVVAAACWVSSTPACNYGSRTRDCRNPTAIEAIDAELVIVTLDPAIPVSQVNPILAQAAPGFTPQVAVFSIDIHSDGATFVGIFPLDQGLEQGLTVISEPTALPGDVDLERLRVYELRFIATGSESDVARSIDALVAEGLRISLCMTPTVQDGCLISPL
ncbi:MAG: hypothetical protein V3U50_05345 [Acidimicrobiia bacterium]